MNNKVLTITELNGVFALELGDNTNCTAFEDLQKNWDKLKDFKEDETSLSLSGFCRSYLQPALALMNDGNIARSISKKNKSPEKIQEETAALRTIIELAFSGVKEDKATKTRRKKGLEDKISEFSNKSWKVNSELEKAMFTVEFEKCKLAIKAVNNKLDKYLLAEYANQEFLDSSLNKLTTLQSKLKISYNKYI